MRKQYFSIFSLILSGVFLFFVSSCEKDDDIGIENVPVLSTTEVTKITANTATSGGNITDDGGITVTARGVCWSTSENPSTQDDKTTDGGGTGSFISLMTGLEPNIKYYAKAYATNSIGTEYGEEISFTTAQISSPEIQTLIPSEISFDFVTLNGNVSSGGGLPIVERGFYLCEGDRSPDINDRVEIVEDVTGNYSKKITGLEPSTTYSYRAFASNSDRTATGEVVSFQTNKNQGGSLTDSRDGNNYRTVRIGDQTWMAENLAYLPCVSPSSSESLTASYYYVYDYEGTSINDAKATDNYKIYGVLYNWPAAMEACPSGWHLPSDDEWKQLEMAIGMSQNEGDDTDWRGTNEGTKLKATNGWKNDGNGIDEYGFGALPGGRRYDGGYFFAVGGYGFWWSASKNDNSTAWRRSLSCLHSDVRRYDFNRGYGFSVRCVRD